MMATVLFAENAATMLETIAAENFAAACAGLRANRRLAARDALYVFVERTQDPVKLRHAMNCLSLKNAEDIRLLAAALARSPEGEATVAKQQLLRETIDRVDVSSRGSLIAHLVEQGFDGNVQSSALWKQILDWVLTEPIAAAKLDERMAKDSTVLDPATVLSASREGKLDMLVFLRLDRKYLGSCYGTITELRQCGETIRNNFGSLGLKLKPRFAAAALRVLSNAPLHEVLSNANSPRQEILEVSALYAPLGLDTDALAHHLCTRGLEATESAENRGKDFDPFAEMIVAIDAKNTCAPMIKRAQFWRNARKGLVIIAAMIGLLVPFPLAAVILRRRYKAIGRAVPTELTPPDSSGGPGLVAGRLNEHAWRRRFDAALRALRTDLENTGDGASQAAAAAITRLEQSACPQLTERLRLVVIEAVESGLLRSLLARIDGMLVYALVFPCQHDDPRSIRRYKSLADGWLVHAKRLHKLARKGQDAGAPVLALLVFLRPDTGEGSLLFGYDDGRLSVNPGPLLDETETREARGRTHADAYPLALAEALT